MKVQTFLKHYGVLGMHWGRRKGRSTVGRPDHPDHVESRRLKSKKLHEMSNEEIRKLTQRMSLEKQFKELTKKPTSPAKKFVMEFLLNNGKSALNAYVAKQIKKKIGPS